jgi:mRNA interferase RelE/StbE
VAITPYHIRIAPAAQRQIRAEQTKMQKLLIKFLEALAVNPRPPGASKIEGMTGLYCEAVNHHRLIYKIEEHEVLLLLLK